jgi:hypothetical protein
MEKNLAELVEQDNRRPVSERGANGLHADKASHHPSGGLTLGNADEEGRKEISKEQFDAFLTKVATPKK